MLNKLSVNCGKLQPIKIVLFFRDRLVSLSEQYVSWITNKILSHPQDILSGVGIRFLST